MHSCPFCSRTYERADHLSRHVNSHQNARTFRCPECSKGFNRRDILQRHQAAHAKNALEGKPQQRRRVDRVSRACEACAAAKAKCNEERPCKRCRIQSEACVDRPSSTFHVSTAPDSDTPALPSPQSTCEYSTPGNGSTIALLEQRRQSQCSNIVSLQPHPEIMTIDHLPSATESQQHQIQDATDSFPNYLNHVMTPATHLMDTLPPAHMPYDVLDFMQNTDFLLDEIDTLDFDFDAGLPSLDPDLFEVGPQEEQTNSSDGAQDAEGTISRIDAFKRSPWFWKPSSAQNAFSDHPRIPLESDSVDVAASPHWPYSVDLIIQDKLSQQTRDRILQLVIQTVGTRVSIPSFPSAEFLDILIKNGIAKKIETDAWIHPHTFCSQTTRTELLTALIAAGCVCFGIMAVGKTGGMLQEIVRVALNNLVESDNSVIRDLQYLQAYMIWIDIGICCGYKRKMEIAESHFQPLCTALRKAGAFNKSFYKRIIPSSADDDATLDRKWRQWVEQESYKRLVYHLFEHDIEVAFSMTRNPLTSYAEFSVPFPAARDIWLAPTPAAWRAIHLSKRRAPDPVYNSLRDVLAKPDRLAALSGDADYTLATSILVHGIGALIWDYRKQASIAADAESDDPTAQLWLQTRRQDLHNLLLATHTTHGPHPAVLTLLTSTLHLNLHAPLDDIQRFAHTTPPPSSSETQHDPDDETDAPRRTLAALRAWSTTRPARVALWHAGQVLRAARGVPPYQLRGFDGIGVYYATLAVWAWGTVSAAGRQEEQQQQQQQRRLGDDERVYLDGAETTQGPAVGAWLANGAAGRPALRWVGEGEGGRGDERVCDVARRPGEVMGVGASVLEGNYPDSAPDELPPMIMSLRDLMRDLGRVP